MGHTNRHFKYLTHCLAPRNRPAKSGQTQIKHRHYNFSALVCRDIRSKDEKPRQLRGCNTVLMCVCVCRGRAGRVVLARGVMGPMKRISTLFHKILPRPLCFRFSPALYILLVSASTAVCCAFASSHCMTPSNTSPPHHYHVELSVLKVQESYREKAWINNKCPYGFACSSEFAINDDCLQIERSIFQTLSLYRNNCLYTTCKITIYSILQQCSSRALKSITTHLALTCYTKSFLRLALIWRPTASFTVNSIRHGF